MRNAYIETLYKLTSENRKVYSFVADNGAIVFDKYRESFPNNFVNFGIAESTMVSVAAGMASCGNIPFIYTIIPFLVMRAYEQIRNDVCMQKMNVKIVGIGAGVRYSTLGPTHHAIEDIALMRVLPNMTVFSPADAIETDKVVEAAVKIKGPVYIRLGTSKEPRVYETDYDFKPGKATILNNGDDATIITTGNAVYDAQKALPLLSKKGINPRLINMHTIKPLDEESIMKAAVETKSIIVIEHHNMRGGLGSAISEVLIRNGAEGIRYSHLGFDDKYCCDYGTHDEVKACYGLSSMHIAKKVEEAITRR